MKLDAQARIALVRVAKRKNAGNAFTCGKRVSVFSLLAIRSIRNSISCCATERANRYSSRCREEDRLLLGQEFRRNSEKKA